MPCPLFVPEPSPDGRFVDFHRGQCAAEPGASIGDEMLRLCCNRGYARGKCASAEGSEADATSFIVKAIGRESVEVAWALEKNHHPVEVGTCAVARNGNDSIGESPLMRQMRAYAAGCF